MYYVLCITTLTFYQDPIKYLVLQTFLFTALPILFILLKRVINCFKFRNYNCLYYFFDVSKSFQMCVFNYNVHSNFNFSNIYRSEVADVTIQ